MTAPTVPVPDGPAPEPTIPPEIAKPKFDDGGTGASYDGEDS